MFYLFVGGLDDSNTEIYFLIHTSFKTDVTLQLDMNIIKIISNSCIPLWILPYIFKCFKLEICWTWNRNHLTQKKRNWTVCRKYGKHSFCWSHLSISKTYLSCKITQENKRLILVSLSEFYKLCIWISYFFTLTI